MIGIVSDQDLLQELASLTGSPTASGPSDQSHPASSIAPSYTVESPAVTPDTDNPVGDIELAGSVTGHTSEHGPGVVIDIQRGRGHTREVPESLRKLVASSLLDGASPKDIEKHLGISPSSSSAYKVGATSTSSYHSPDPALLDHVTSKRGQITDRATRKLLLALKNISPQLVENAKLKELSGLAKDMSTVMRNMDQSANNPLLGGSRGPTYIFYAPRIKKEDDFEVVSAGPDEQF